MAPRALPPDDDLSPAQDRATVAAVLAKARELGAMVASVQWSQDGRTWR